MLRKVGIVLGVVLIVTAVAWKAVISPRAELRFPDDWTWEVNTIGLTSYAGENGQFPEGTTLKDDPINITVRHVSAESEDAPAGQVVISDHYETRNATTNAVEWEFTSNAVVDQKTGKRVNDAGQLEDYYFLPRNLDRSQSYRIANSSYNGIEMTFQREENIGGLNTYLYAYYADLTNINAYPDQELAENQTITCFDFALEYWVEPTTGEIVKFREWCEGDWVVDSTTGERLFALQRWGGETAGDDLIRHVTEIGAQLNNFKWMSLYIPLILGGLGIVLLVASLLSSRRTAA